MNPNSGEPSNDIRLDRFKELSDGEPAALLELIELYLTKTDEQLQELKRAVNKHSNAEVARIAHSMVGANAMVGLDSVVPALRSLEESAEGNNSAEIQRLFKLVSLELGRIQSALKKYALELA